MGWRERALARFYDPRRGFVDGTTEFHALAASVIPRGGRILEIGSGPSNNSSAFFASLGRVVGIDVDPAVRDNTFLTESHVFDGGRFPIEDGSADACVSNYVLEHVPDPRSHFAEVRRVLRPGGVYVLRTPNRYHYVGFVSWVTPHWVHDMLANKLRGLPADAHDPYPTVYGANSIGAIRKLCASAGLTLEHLRTIEKEPSYGMASPALFYPLLAYERIVNSTERLAFLRSNLLAVCRKP